MIRFTAKDLNAILGEFLGRPYTKGATGPDAYDCYGLVGAFTRRIGMEIPEIGVVDPKDTRPVYEQQQAGYIQLDWPRPWSLVTFSGRDLNAHIGVVLPDDNLFLHCPGRAAGMVIAEPLSRRPWRDSIDGYWWPKGWIEAVIMLSPIGAKPRAWQFVRGGRSLQEIIQQDIVPGQQIDVRAYIGSELVEDWTCVPTENDQVVIRPVLADGDRAGAMIGMLALAAFAPYVAGALVPAGAPAAVAAAAAAGGQVAAGTIFAYNLAMGATMMAGGLALNALVGSDEAEKGPSQYYGWNQQTNQEVGAILPLVYGTFGVRGTVISSYMTSELTTDINPWTKTTYVAAGKELVHAKIAYSDGPIEGIIEDGTEELNGRSLGYYDEVEDFAVEHFRGTSNQAASSMMDGFEIPVNENLVSGTPSTDTFTAVECDRVAVVLRFDGTFGYQASDGDFSIGSVPVKIELRESGGSWSTLMNDTLYGKMRHGLHLLYYCNETYTGGSPFTITEGTSYEVRVTRTGAVHAGNEFLFFDSIQCLFTSGQKHPGLAYTSIKAAASKDLSGSLDYYAVIKGKLVCIYDAGGNVTSIEWSDNPAWIAVDLLTRPVISGDGDGVPYAVEYYKRRDPSGVIMADFITLETWCDVMVDDGEGGTEKRYRFNGVFDSDGDATSQAQRACKMACASLRFEGQKVGCVIDKPGTPTQMFNVSNLTDGFCETWIDNSEAATVIDADFIDEDSGYVGETYPVPLAGAAEDIPISMDCFGHTKRSQVWRRASRQLRVNQHMKRMVRIPACLDAIWTSLNDIVYVQHPCLQRATGGRIVEVYANGIKTDKVVTLGAGDYALLIRTHDGSAERLNLYEVVSVTGGGLIITISGVWEYTPEVMDLWTFGLETKVIDLYRVKEIERTRHGRVMLTAMQYTTDYYADDEEAPKIEAQVYKKTLGGRSPALLPTTRQSVEQNRINAASTVDSLAWQGLTFTGDDLDTVTWECDGAGGAGIKYKGTWCPIMDDAVGTADTYIYFDPNLGDPRYLQHTNDLQSLINWERYVFCVNIDGVAHLKNGVLITYDDLKLNGVEAGADVTGDHPEDIVFRQVDPPAHKAGRVWLNMDWCGAWCRAHWRMDDTSSTSYRIQDSSYSRNVATAAQYPSALTTTGKNVYGFTFNGSSDCITVSTFNNVIGTGDLSAFAWIKTSYTADIQRILCKRLVNVGFDFLIDATGKLGLMIADAGGYTYLTITPAASIRDGEWHLIGFAVNRDGNSYICVDGVLSTAMDFTSRSGSIDVADPLYIGRFNTAISYFNGTMDNVAIYRRFLRQADWDGIWDGGTGTQQLGLGSNRMYMISDGTTWRMANSDAVWVPQYTDDLQESETQYFAGEHGADVTADNPIDTFFEGFDDPRATVSQRWVTVSGFGTGEIAIASISNVSGGYVLDCGNNSGNDEVCRRYFRPLIFDPARLYRIRFRIFRMSGSGTARLGVGAIAADGSTFVDYQGNNANGGAHWMAAYDVAPGSWTVYTAYLKGRSATGSTGAAFTDPANPAVLHDDARYFYPMFLTCYDDATGRFMIDEISIDVIPDDADQIPAGATNKFAAESGANVTENRTAAAIAGQGALATKSTVDTPEIVNGAVITSKIGMNAVTDVIYNEYTGSYIQLLPSKWGDDYYGKTSVVVETTLFASSGAPVFITFSGEVDIISGSASCLVRIFLRRNDDLQASISDITLTGTNKVLITTSSSHGLSTSDYVWIDGVGGTTQLNDGIYIVNRISDTTFQLEDTDSSLFSAFTSGGTVKKVDSTQFPTWIKVTFGESGDFAHLIVESGLVDTKEYYFLGTIRNYSETTNVVFYRATLVVLELKR